MSSTHLKWYQRWQSLTLLDDYCIFRRNGNGFNCRNKTHTLSFSSVFINFTRAVVEMLWCSRTRIYVNQKPRNMNGKFTESPWFLNISVLFVWTQDSSYHLFGANPSRFMGQPILLSCVALFSLLNISFNFFNWKERLARISPFFGY